MCVRNRHVANAIDCAPGLIGLLLLGFVGAAADAFGRRRPAEMRRGLAPLDRYEIR